MSRATSPRPASPPDSESTTAGPSPPDQPQEVDAMTLLDINRGNRPSRASLVSAFVVPVLVIGQAAWATYVVCYQLAHQRLMKRDKQMGAGYAVIVLQALFTFMAGVTYMRLFQVIYTDPGLLPLGMSRAKPEDGGSDDMKAVMKRWSEKRSIIQHTAPEDARTREELFKELAAHNQRQAELRMEALKSFRPKDMFVVAPDGLPRWCKTCETFKPDRTHHCSDLGRCVRRMDHFCPWVGGIVSETTTKFFVQFLLYAMLLCIFMLATTITLFKRDNDRYGQRNPQLIALLVLSGVYTLFTVGMFQNSMWMLAKNFTTIEQRQFDMPLHLAVRISPDWYAGNVDHLPCYMVVSFPSAPGEKWAIFQTEPRAKLWDLGGAYANVCQVLGNRVWEWVLPVTYSPCAKPADDVSEYPFGPAALAVTHNVQVPK
ncbi:DHHC palmitoyltransferase-domain-containing protein [Phyllosticta citrichinensis]|uniref:Palmitoyltransferase n=1 Tax=Phyllosticta citrichinensis TaxID=1130410 RepID=A0ABR1Y5B8_9PEZI